MLIFGIAVPISYATGIPIKSTIQWQTAITRNELSSLLNKDLDDQVGQNRYLKASATMHACFRKKRIKKSS